MTYYEIGPNKKIPQGTYYSTDPTIDLEFRQNSFKIWEESHDGNIFCITKDKVIWSPDLDDFIFVKLKAIEGKI